MLHYRPVTSNKHISQNQINQVNMWTINMQVDFYLEIET
jgi:hypothetical protein